MLKQTLKGTVFNGAGLPVSNIMTVTTFPNSVVSIDLIKKTVLTSTVGVDGKFSLEVPKFVECSVKVTASGVNIYTAPSAIDGGTFN